MIIIINRCDNIARPPALSIVILLRGTNDGHYACIKRIEHFRRLNYAFTRRFKRLVKMHHVGGCVSDKVAIPVIVSLIDICFYIFSITVIPFIKLTWESLLCMSTFNVYFIVHTAIILESRSSTILT